MFKPLTKSLAWRAAAISMGLLLGLWRLQQQNKAEQVSFPAPAYNVLLTADDLKFGKEQLDAMLRDRPEMKASVVGGDVMYSWAAQQFGGQATGQRIYWSNAEPEARGALSSASNPQNGEPGTIKIRSVYAEGQLRGFHLPRDLLWSCFVFEVFNLTGHKTLTSNFEGALAGRVSKDEWMLGIAKVEYASRIKTRAFYVSAWAPFTESKSVVSVPKNWQMGGPTNFEDWIQLQRNQDGYPESYFGAFYDQNILPNIKTQ